MAQPSVASGVSPAVPPPPPPLALAAQVEAAPTAVSQSRLASRDDVSTASASSAAAAESGVDDSNEPQAVAAAAPPPPPAEGDGERAAQWAALKAQRWASGKALTAHVQDLALAAGKRALVATSGGSYKKFVCSSEAPCGWLINAVCSRPRRRPSPASSNGNGDTTNETADRFWYVTSGSLVHDAACASVAKPTARQLKQSALLQSAVQTDARVSSAVLVEQLKAQEHLVCSKSMVYKAKTDLLDALEADRLRGRDEPGGGPPPPPLPVAASVQKLPSYLAQMTALNAHTTSCVERDDAGRFVRAVLAMDPTGVWNDQCVLGVDAIEMQHAQYNGTQLLLLGRDGNLQPLVHAVALVPDDASEHCAWFLDKLIAHGFPLRRFPVFINARWGLSTACGSLQLPHVMVCTQHLLDDMRTARGLALSSDDEALVWQAQRAESESEYLATVARLGQLNPPAAHFVKSLDAKRWALFPYLTARKMYGWQTTQLSAVDTGQAMGLAPHAQLPFESFKALSLVLMNGSFQRHERAVQWERERRVVTPEAERLMQDELARVGVYNVVMSTPQLAFVWNAAEPQIRQRRVDLQHRTCTCALRLQWGVPCRHVLAALHKLGGGALLAPLAFDFFDECYLVRNYVSSFKGRYLELPLDEAVAADAALRPPRLVNKAGNGVSDTAGESQQQQQQQQQQSEQQPAAKKRRVRTRPVSERKRGMYKCHRCHRAEGHNRGTCPYAPEPQ